MVALTPATLRTRAMIAVQESVIARKRAALAAFHRRMGRAIYGHGGGPSPASDDVHDIDH